MALSLAGSGSDVLYETVAATSGYPMTVAFWAYPTSSSPVAAFRMYSFDANERYQITQSTLWETTGRAGGTFFASTAGQTCTLNTWQHVCAVWESSSSIKMSVNGASFTVANPTATPGTCTETGYGGGRISGVNPTASFIGRFAEFGIWNVALSQADAVALSKGFTPSEVRPQSLTRCRRFVRSVQDLKGNAGTSIGMTTVTTHPRVYG